MLHASLAMVWLQPRYSHMHTAGTAADALPVALLYVQVDVSAMVPTVVLGLLQHVAAHKLNHLHSLKRVVIGGAAPPRSMIEAVEG